MKRCFIMLGCLFILLPSIGIADQTAITKNGKEVLLKDDGTWEFIKIDSKKIETAFRKTTWGMNKNQVKKAESAKFIQEQENILMFNGKISNYDAAIGYIFASEKLVRGAYIIQEKHINQTDYISDYTAIKEMLKSKYGEPKEDKTLWKNNLYQDDPQYWGMAVSMGHLLFYTTWETDQTKIIEVLQGDNFEITHKIEYSSKYLQGIEEKEKEEKSLDDL